MRLYRFSGSGSSELNCNRGVHKHRRLGSTRPADSGLEHRGGKGGVMVSLLQDAEDRFAPTRIERSRVFEILNLMKLAPFNPGADTAECCLCRPLGNQAAVM